MCLGGPLHSFGRGTADARRQAITYSASAVSRLAACRPAATLSRRLAYLPQSQIGTPTRTNDLKAILLPTRPEEKVLYHRVDHKRKE
ncbi:hypothetical protein BHE74_00003197 [Ensete ventricosum]|nr:hypothetical protein BHE74_00003197 [Ensete ventricosum]